jgi:hypothetical protein
MFDLCQATIRNYIKSYNQQGLDGLMPKKPSGRPPKIAHWTKQQWDDVLQQTPDQYEKLDTHSHQWTLGLMTKYLREYHLIEVSTVSVHNSLRKTDRRTGRSKLRVGSPDPDYVVKRDRVNEVQNLALQGQLTSAATELIVPDKQLIVPDKQLVRLGYPEIVIPRLRGRLFYFDEANLSLCPQTGRVYRVVGEEYKVDSPGNNITSYILGSVEYPSGNGLYEIYPHKTNKEVQTHWQHLLDMCPGDFLFVVRDNASQHVTPKLDSFLIANRSRLCLVPLPTHSPHLNLIERLWHYMRDKITRSHFSGTFKLLCEKVVAWLRDLPFERFCSLLGVP